MEEVAREGVCGKVKDEESGDSFESLVLREGRRRRRKEFQPGVLKEKKDEEAGR